MFNVPRKKLIAKIALALLIMVLTAGVAYASFIVFKINSFGHKISFTPDHQNILDTIESLAGTKKIALRGADTGQINVLLMGIQGEGKVGPNLTDTMMVASINTQTDQVALLSIPRDLYVSEDGWQDKINTCYQRGLSGGMSNDQAAKYVEKTITDITGLDINYYVVLDFNGFIKVIDAVGGINIQNDRDIYDPSYPGPNYSYEPFELKKGFYKNMDGATALKYARERHDDPEGDFGRAKRQQQIMQATKNKIFSAETLLNVVAMNNLFNALGADIKTDINLSEISDWIELAKRVDTDNITNVVLTAWDKDSLLKVSHVNVGNMTAFVLIPRVGNYSEVHDLAANIFDLNALTRRRDQITQENARVAIINQSGDATLTGKIQKLLSINLSYKNVAVLYDTNKTTTDETDVYDLSQKSETFTLDELITKLPAKLSASGPGADIESAVQNTSPDIVVVLGKDLATRYNMAEDSVADYEKANQNN